MTPMTEFVQHLTEVFRLFGPVRSRRMFGGYGVYHQDVMIGLVADDTLFLKTDAVSAQIFSDAGCRPFEYSKHGTTLKMSYFSAPSEVLEDPHVAKTWAALAYDAALRSRGGAKRRRQSRA